MKKMFFLAVCLSSTILLADSVKLEGTIAQIYDNNKTLLIDSVYGGQIAIKVLPNTEIEMDDCGIFGTDKEGTFKDLKQGDFLESKIFYGMPISPNASAVPVARKIEIQCYKKAY
ncbi:hypothetical protein H2277_05800 [Campylobacter sp. W0014]|uniref:hypothetical protein n=1 Tax=Campylobacter sp. W0014 TaxID=2735781 RepID=UPI001EBC4711|nr:hypothetical protein [Campylobacter sp. W0014]